METLLITDAELIAATPLGGNIDPPKFKFCIADAQVSKLEELLGEPLYNKLKAHFEEVQVPVTGDYLILLDKYVKPFLIHQAAVEYIMIGSYQIKNGGIYKHSPANSTNVDVSEVNFLVKNQKAKADIYESRMQRYLDLKDFPEYTYNNNNSVNPSYSDTTDFDFI